MPSLKETIQIDSIADIVRKAEEDFTSGETTISKYVSVSMHETLNRIDAYINSKHISGELDSMGREKPFFNIVTAARNIWFRATDIDRKNIHIKATKAVQDIPAFLATIHLQNWMRKARFGQFLNKWGLTLATYGSAVTKFVETDKELTIQVVPWSRIICDPIDFASNPVIEILEFTPAQLRKNKNYDQDQVEALIEAVESREDKDGEKKDNRSNYIKLYEIHGDLPVAYLKEDPSEDDKYNFRQQMHVISYVRTKENEKEWNDFTLFKGKEKKSPYQKDDLIEADDQTLSIGAVQNLFEAQWMVNHTAKNIKDQLDIASKIIFQTSDGNFVGQNVLDAIEQGDILIHQVNMPLTAINNRADIVAHQSFGSQWQALGNQINGISEAMLGIGPKSGTAWRQTAALLQESQSLFEIMTENKGLSIDDMMREHILPFVKKKIDTTKEISATLEEYQIDKIDSLYVPNEAIRRYNKKATEAVLEGDDVPLFEPEFEQNGVKADLAQQGNQRFFKPSEIETKEWSAVLKDLEWELEIDITQEQRDMQMVMETLNTALKYVTSATPEQLADPNFKLVFNEILRATSVISPVQIASRPPTPPAAPASEISESLSYKDVPEDVKRQMESRAGMQPAQAPAPEPQQAKVPAMKQK